MVRFYQGNSTTSIATIISIVIDYPTTTTYNRRWFNHVNSYNNRHSIKLPNDIVSVNTLLKLSIGSVKDLLQSLLCNNSPLVEFAALISSPGSENQLIHSDIPSDVDSNLISCFVAMQNVSIDSGPTCLYSASHSNEFHRYRNNIIHPKSSQATYYDSDGSLIEEENNHNNADADDNIDIDLREKNDAINSSIPIAAILQVGDILMFNCKIFHFGSENVSLLDRLLLSFTFQSVDMNGESIPVKGFTYHLSDDMKSDNKILENFTRI